MLIKAAVHAVVAGLLMLAFACDGDPESVLVRVATEEVVTPDVSSQAVPLAVPKRESRSDLPDCDVYVEKASRYLDCDPIPQGHRVRKELDLANRIRLETTEGSAEQLRAANDACRKAIMALEEGAVALGCSLEVNEGPGSEGPGSVLQRAPAD